MNKYLYNKIITSVSKVVKKSINEAYDTSSIYDNRYISSDEQSILNYSGNIGDILQVNQYGEYRVNPSNLDINESMFDDIDFDDDEYGVSDKLNEWKDFAICFGEGLWVYLDWIGLNKRLSLARQNTRLYKNKIPDINGYENTQYILNNYKIKGTIWEEVQNCEYPIYIPDINQLERIYNINKKYKLLPIYTHVYWSSSQYASSSSNYYGAFGVDFNSGYVGYVNKTYGYRSVTLLHF